MFPIPTPKKSLMSPARAVLPTPSPVAGPVRLLSGPPKLAIWTAGVSVALAGFALDAYLFQHLGKEYRDTWDL